MSSRGKKPPPAAPPAAAAPARSRLWPWAFLSLAVLAAATVRFRLRDMPLERDEGEYAYAGQLMLEGVPPYQLAYNMKFPGTYAAYAAIMAVFGQTTAGVHLGLIVVTSATTVLVFLIARRLLGDLGGVAAAAGHAALAMSISLLALAGHATHFVVLPATGGVLLLLRGIEREGRWTLLGSGALLGLAILMKQPGACFLLFALAYLVWIEWQARPVAWRRFGARAGLVILGAAIPLGLTFVGLWAAGVFDRFWFWTVEYARHYGTMVPLGKKVQFLVNDIPEYFGPAAWLWALAGVGLAAAVGDQQLRTARPLLIGLAVFSLLGTSAGPLWRNHYFILALPAAALLIGAAVSAAAQWLSADGASRAARVIPVLALVAALGHALYEQGEVFFAMTPEEACRDRYTANPFPESVTIAEYLRAHTSPTDRIAVLGSEPQICFYAHRRSATGYIYMYALLEPHPYARRMQDEMIREIEEARPAYVVVVNVDTSWLPRPGSDRTIFEWADRYTTERYDLVGVADIQSMTHTEYRWDAAAANYKAASPYFVLVYRVRAAPPAGERP